MFYCRCCISHFCWTLCGEVPPNNIFRERFEPSVDYFWQYFSNDSRICQLFKVVFLRRCKSSKDTDLCVRFLLAVPFLLHETTFRYYITGRTGSLFWLGLLSSMRDVRNRALLISSAFHNLLWIIGSHPNLSGKLPFSGQNFHLVFKSSSSTNFGYWKNTCDGSSEIPSQLGQSSEVSNLNLYNVSSSMVHQKQSDIIIDLTMLSL